MIGTVELQPRLGELIAGTAVACQAAGAFLMVAAFGPHGLFLAGDGLTTFLVGILVWLVLGFPFAITLFGVAAWMKIAHPTCFLACGIFQGLATGAALEWMKFPAKGPLGSGFWLLVATAGALAGLVYWIVVVRSADKT